MPRVCKVESLCSLRLCAHLQGARRSNRITTPSPMTPSTMDTPPVLTKTRPSDPKLSIISPQAGTTAKVATGPSCLQTGSNAKVTERWSLQEEARDGAEGREGLRRNLKTAVQAVVIQELKPDRARDESSASKEWAGLLQSPKVQEYLQGVRSMWDAKIKKFPPIGLIGSAPLPPQCPASISPNRSPLQTVNTYKSKSRRCYIESRSTVNTTYCGHYLLKCPRKDGICGSERAAAMRTEAAARHQGGARRWSALARSCCAPPEVQKFRTELHPKFRPSDAILLFHRPIFPCMHLDAIFSLFLGPMV